MDPKLFEQKLSEVADWILDKHQGHSYESKGRAIEEDLAVPTYPRILNLKDRPCPYKDDEKNCEIIIRQMTDFGEKFYYQRCKTCHGVIINGQYKSGRGEKNITKFALDFYRDTK